MTIHRLARTAVLSLAAGALFAGGAARAADAPVPVPAPPAIASAPEPVAAVEPAPAVDGESAVVCDDVVASQDVSAIADDLVLAGAGAASEAASCKPCRGRTWCKCTYNGQPRSSCDPCCYTNDIGVTVCLD